jgi:hypothetical protein
VFKSPFKLNWNNKLKAKPVPQPQQVNPFDVFDQNAAPKKMFNLQTGENFGYDPQGNYFGSDSPLAEEQRQLYRNFIASRKGK